MELSSHLDYIVQRFSLYNEGESSRDVKLRLLKEDLGMKILKLEALINYSYEMAVKRMGYTSLEEFRKDLENFSKLPILEKENILDILLSKKNIRTRLI